MEDEGFAYGTDVDKRRDGDRERSCGLGCGGGDLFRCTDGRAVKNLELGIPADEVGFMTWRSGFKGIVGDDEVF